MSIKNIERKITTSGAVMIGLMVSQLMIMHTASFVNPKLFFVGLMLAELVCGLYAVIHIVEWVSMAFVQTVHHLTK